MGAKLLSQLHRNKDMSLSKFIKINICVKAKFWNKIVKVLTLELCLAELYAYKLQKDAKLLREIYPWLESHATKSKKHLDKTISNY